MSYSTNNNSTNSNSSNVPDHEKYQVYRNDIKFRKHQNIDPSKAIWADDVAKDFKEKDTDGIDYRVSECIREKYELLDLSRMNGNCFVELMKHKEFLKIKKHLKHLFIAHSELKKLEDLDGFVVLETLDVTDNELTVLPKLPNSLEEITIAENKITLIPHQLPLLKRLNAQNNQIKTLFYSPTLEKLILKNNPIETIIKLDKLYHLDISGTKISFLPNFPKVRVLDCSFTSIERLDKMDALKILICNDSKLEDISKLLDLEELEMIRSKIVNVHFMESLYILLYNSSDNIRLSKKYKITNVKKNQRDIMEIIFNHSS